MIYILVAKEHSPPVDIPGEISTLLEQFRNITPEKLPTGPLSLMDIQHQIDLISSVVLSNKAHYQMSSKEHEELNCQVMNLLSKGYIQEILSLCAVPTLLTPKNYGF